MTDEKKCAFCHSEPIVQYIGSIGDSKTMGIGFYCRQVQNRKRKVQWGE